jgi:hypothetical protein
VKDYGFRIAGYWFCKLGLGLAGEMVGAGADGEGAVREQWKEGGRCGMDGSLGNG